jgi:ubiquinone/menaquinone biosynthesis C-methylase UbiE
MKKTEKNSVEKFYEKLTEEGLAAHAANETQQEAQLQFLKNHLSKDQKILDLACGYGRLTIPLAQAGYKVEGIDLVPSLIKKAKELTQEENLKIKFKIGDIRDLACKENSFDAVICMWSSFNHLLTQKDQIKSLKEILRVLCEKGIAIIDLPYFRKPTKEMLQLGEFLDDENHLFKREFRGVETILFLHSKQSLEKVLKAAKIETYKIKYVDIGGKRRLVLYLWK